MLPSRERLELSVELRAVADKAVDVLRVLSDVEAAQEGRTARGRKLACERVSA